MVRHWLHGIEGTGVRGVEFVDEEDALASPVGPSKGRRNRCRLCPSRCAAHEAGLGRC
jgi:hypothetical protein